MTDKNYEMKAHVGVLSTNEETGWTKELNIISWNGEQPQYDLREWNPDHTEMTEGITMNELEIGQLRLLLI